jgi:hypothetical protein
MLKIYTWEDYLKKNNRAFWFPLLFELYHLKNKELFQCYKPMKNLSSADIFILPLEIGWFYRNRKESLFFEILKDVKSSGKKIWIYSAGDYGKSLNHKILYTFRLGGFNSKLNQNTFILPSFINDPVELYQREIKVLGKTDRPKIGFVGRANNSIYNYLYDFGIFVMLYFKRILGNNYVDHQSFFSSSKKRFKLLKCLNDCPDIETDFIYRNKYKAGAKNDADRLKTKTEFLNNIENNLYTMCYRGQGNYSVRLYEVLAMGRIPLLINSDFRLALPWKDWNGHVIVSNEDEISERLLQFHSNYNENELEELQLKNRVFWKDNFTRTGFFIEMYKYFKDVV